MKCCICGKEFTGYGNNPYPVKKQGKYCNACNVNKVIPTRLISAGIITIQSKYDAKTGDNK